MGLDNEEGKLLKIYHGKGIKTRYAVGGAGSPVLLIHGFGQFLEVWGFNIFPLSKHYLVCAMDLPGHGLSDKPSGKYTLSFATEFITDFMQTLGIERASLIGHSLGGLIGLNAAINFPERVDQLILVDCGGLSKEVPFFYRLCTVPVLGELIMMPTIKAGLKYGIKRAFYNPDLVIEEMINIDYEFMNMPKTKQAMLNLIRSNANFKGLYPEVIITDKLHLIKSPTLFIHGEQDKTIPFTYAQDACKLIPNARLKVIAKCGHCPHIEKAPEFNGAVIAFLESNG
ncbi:MAG: alpha/beta hydrolase [Dehalococcoidales bacterium]|nr:alpha/beta hydrolase [Dehalococcoidales bacterium]